jgi:hypothetical protein
MDLEIYSYRTFMKWYNSNIHKALYFFSFLRCTPSNIEIWRFFCKTSILSETGLLKALTHLWLWAQVLTDEPSAPVLCKNVQLAQFLFCCSLFKEGKMTRCTGEHKNVQPYTGTNRLIYVVLDFPPGFMNKSAGYGVLINEWTRFSIPISQCREQKVQ